MKKIIPLLLISLALVSCQEELSVRSEYPIEPITKSGDDSSKDEEPAISKWDALEIVEPITSKYPDRWVDISEEIIPAGTILEYNPMGIKVDLDTVSTITSPEFDSWLAVIGPDGKNNGGQEQLHVFINCSTGEYYETLLYGRALIDWDTTRNSYIDNKEDNSRLRTKAIPESRSSSPTQWAVILNAASSSSTNYLRFWNDCQYAYIALTQELSYPSNHIFCLASDGIDPSVDRRISSTTYDNSPVDFDGDGYIDVSYSATKSNLSTVFCYLGSVVSEGDEVLVFITGYSSSSSYLTLWGGETVTPSQLDAEFDKLGISVTIDVVMGQSYSGGFISALSEQNRTIATAVTAAQSSHGSMPYGGYNYFLRYWTDPIYNANPSVSGTHSNGDGYLSLFELFEYTKDTPVVNDGFETPQKSANPDILFWGHDLEGNNFVPYIVGDDYASTNEVNAYTLYGLPSSLSPSWSCSSNLRVVTSYNSSANISGYGLLPSQYFSTGGVVTVGFSDLGENWSITKDIAYIWKPGAYIGYNYITRTYNSYHLIDYFSVGTYPGTSNYQWFSNSPSWNIISQDGAYVTVQNVPPGTTNVSVVFEDPFGGTIYISDQVN